MSIRWYLFNVKVDAIDTSGLVKKKIDYGNKITEIEGKIPGITGLATTAALNAIKNMIAVNPVLIIYMKK